MMERNSWDAKIDAGGDGAEVVGSWRNMVDREQVMDRLELKVTPVGALSEK
jgi:hypothetical protein